MLENLFHLKQNHTNVRTEAVAGLTTFMTMAYILAVNPSILSAAGMDTTAVMLATCLASFIGSICMGLMANLPFALSAGMGINAFMAYTVVLTYGYSWQLALLTVFIEGVLFILLSNFGIREKIFDSIPLSLKHGVSVGLGIFIAFIGMQNAGIVVSSSTLISVFDFQTEFHTAGISALLAIIGTLLTAILYIRKVPGAILLGILGTWVIGMLCQVTGLYVPDPAAGFYSLFPSFTLTDFSRLGETFGACFHVDLHHVGFFNFVVVIISFLFVDIFDTLGTLIGVGSKADMLDENGRLPKIRSALLADAIATAAGAVLGTSTTTTFVESAAGVGAGGRTGLTAVVTGLLFLLSTLLAPIFTAIPSFATAPALIIVGFLMFTTISKISLDEDNLTEAIPAYLCILGIPLFYSISEGIAIGVISYVVLNLFCGKAKKVHALMYILAVLFILKFIFL